MMKIFVLMLISSLSLIGCTTSFKSKTVSTNVVTESTLPVGNKDPSSITAAMDENDKNKLSHALDSALGKSTEWENKMTGVKYSAVPIEKLTIDGNSFCRKYKITSTQNGVSKETFGTACVSPTDSNWERVS